MAQSRFLADQNKVAGIFESGTYAVALGSFTGSPYAFWIGQVTDNSMKDEEHIILTRYMGTATRNINQFDLGQRDITGKMTYYPQDSRLIFWAIGSVFDVSGTNSQHTVTEVNNNVVQSAYTSGILNPPYSFTIEDSRTSAGTNFVRTINGVVPNSLTIKAKQNAKIEVDVNYLGQTVSYSSGTTASITENKTRSFLWSDLTLTLGGVGANNGSVINTAKDVTFEIKQTRTGPHYLNGSRDISVPINGNRDYILTVVMDLDDTNADMLYKQFYKSNFGGSVFHGIYDLKGDNSTTGSQHLTLNLSGVRIITMDSPTKEAKGPVEGTIVMQVQTVNGVSYDGINLISGLYNQY